MKLVTSLEELPQNAVLAMGAFDGVHLGHQRILSAALAFAEETHREPWAVTFDPSPSEILTPNKPQQKIEPASQRLFSLYERGFENIAVLPFNEAMASLPAEAFAEQIAHATIFCGEDWRFGAKASGTPEFLQAHHIDVRVQSYADYQGERISSTRIRAAIAAGQFADVAGMLGHPLYYNGLVIHGRHLATATFGVPTANFALEPELVAPAKGVYFAKAMCEQGTYRALVNFGTAPTVKGLDAPIFEAHLLDFTGDLYGQEMLVAMDHNLLRGECSFASLDALKQQILTDLAQIRNML